MLLRIVAAAGAGALVGACSSGSGTESGHPCGSAGFCGSAVMVPDAGDESVVGGGVMVQQDAGLPEGLDARADGDAELPCGTGVCGSIALPVPDAGDASVVGGGVMVRPDAASDQ